MSLQLNEVTIAGNLTRDPEPVEAGSAKLLKFGIATNRRWKDRNGDFFMAGWISETIPMEG